MFSSDHFKILTSNLDLYAQYSRYLALPDKSCSFIIYSDKINSNIHETLVTALCSDISPQTVGDPLIGGLLVQPQPKRTRTEILKRKQKCALVADKALPASLSFHPAYGCFQWRN